MDAPLRCVFKPRSPTRTNLEKTIARFKLKFFKAIFKFPQRGGTKRFVWVFVDPLSITRRFGIQETQEELGINVVMGADRALVGMDLPEQ